ncbi:MAG: hypothetical protein HY459_03705 [Parcubacteria group bacterium]|nr:hypothetical protein [Parcubacteria group bacterium]
MPFGPIPPAEDPFRVEIITPLERDILRGMVEVRVAVGEAITSVEVSLDDNYEIFSAYGFDPTVGSWLVIPESGLVVVTIDTTHTTANFGQVFYMFDTLPELGGDLAVLEAIGWSPIEGTNPVEYHTSRDEVRVVLENGNLPAVKIVSPIDDELVNPAAVAVVVAVIANQVGTGEIAAFTPYSGKPYYVRLGVQPEGGFIRATLDLSEVTEPTVTLTASVETDDALFRERGDAVRVRLK